MAQSREQVVQAAEKYVARGKIEPAIREYRKLLADHPNDINTLNRIGDLYARIQRIDEAVDFFLQIAEQYTAEGFFVKAIAIYKKIIKLDPTRLEVYEQLAELYHKQGLVNEARTQYQVLGDYYSKHQNAASAIAIYQKMVQLEPDNPTYHVKLAEIYHQQQLIEKAMGEYRIIAELMIQHGRPQEAAQVYERALDLDSQNLGFIEAAARRLREADYAEGATRFLSVASERNPQAELVARKFRDLPAAPAAPVFFAPEPEIEAGEPYLELEIEEDAGPSPGGMAGMAGGGELGAILGDDELSLDLEDDLARAMAEAAAAVGGRAPAPAHADPESEEIELDLDGVFGADAFGDNAFGDNAFEVDLPEVDEEEEPASLVKPPADMLATPARPAWSQEATPAPGAAFSQRPRPADPEPAEPEEIEIELDLDDPFGGGAGLGGIEAGGWTTEPPPWLAGELAEDAVDDGRAPGFSEIESEIELDIDMEDELAPAAAEPERPEVLDLVTEAEVLAKYGLEDKAAERLNEALRLRPDHLEAYALLIQIHLDKGGHHAQVIELANRMSEAAASHRKPEPWQKVRKKLVDAGLRIEGERVFATPQAAPRPVGRPGQVDDLLKDILGPSSKAPRAPRPVPAPPPPPEPEPEPELLDLPDELFEEPVLPEPDFPEPAILEPDFLEPAFPEQDVEPLFPEADEILFAPEPAPPQPPPPVAPPPPAPSRSVFDPLQIGELVESEAEDWSGLDLPVPGGPVAPPPQTVASSADMLDDTGSMSWLDEADRHREENKEAAAGIFAEEDDFFDLAGELVEELSREEVFQRDGGSIQSEQSLEDIVEGFKKGVAEHLSPTDYDTHFNLGIAYREMGLLDEAVGEFQLAAKDPAHLVLCCSMLGLCFLDKGMPDLAIKWYSRALETPGLHQEDQLGMLYDLGSVYLQLGDNASAYNTFSELYGIDADYRDVLTRLEELAQ